MPTFSPGEEKTAQIHISNLQPMDLVCDVELYLGSNKVAEFSSITVPANFSIELLAPITMPTEPGTYPVKVFACGEEIETTAEDVTITTGITPGWLTQAIVPSVDKPFMYRRSFSEVLYGYNWGWTSLEMLGFDISSLSGPDPLGAGYALVGETVTIAIPEYFESTEYEIISFHYLAIIQDWVWDIKITTHYTGVDNPDCYTYWKGVLSPGSRLSICFFDFTSPASVPVMAASLENALAADVENLFVGGVDWRGWVTPSLVLVVLDANKILGIIKSYTWKRAGIA